MSCASGKKYDVFEVGVLHPENTPLKSLKEGLIGYVVTNMKAAGEANVGDTYYKEHHKVTPLPGFA
jgi:translation elongation factor EF-4